MEFFTELLAQVMQAEYLGGAKTIDIKDISIDSRSLRNTHGTLFFALKGVHHDGHFFVEELFQKGVRFFVVEKKEVILKENACFFVVKDSKKALQNFVAYYRSLFAIPVIGITGSNGKTIVKEWLNFLLSPLYTIIKSPKSYNSQVGVPLSVIAINEKHTLGIFEAGISMPDEMEALEKIIQPTIGILTSIGAAHEEGFLSREQKIEEKMKLLSHARIVVFEQANEIHSHDYFSHQEVWDWSTDASSKAKVHFSVLENNVLEVKTSDQVFTVKVPFSDPISLHNIATCITTLLSMSLAVDYIQEWVPKLYKVELRLQVIQGQRDCTLIDDSYSSDYQSLKIALDFLEQQKTNQQKTIILSDVFQSGFSEEILYAKVQQLLEQNQISKIIGIGPQINKYLQHVSNFIGFSDTELFLSNYPMNLFKNETILIKGSRSFAFEKIVTELEEKTHETVLEINLDAITHNLNYYKSKLLPTTKVMAMVKAFGYGNGSYEIAKHLAHHQVHYLGVAFADEGVELRKAGIQIPIIIMNPEHSAFSSMIAYQLEPEIYSIQELQAFLKEAQAHNLFQYPIHIKLNTGMNRLGFSPRDLDTLLVMLKNTNLVQVASIFSHLATSDMPEESAFALQQIQWFEEGAEKIMRQLKSQPILHILNTSGVYHYSKYQKDMVRLGIGLYGVGNNPEENQHLQNVATLKTIILQINEIEAGDSVGYGRKYRANEPRRIATIPIGYADGIRRSYGNGKGYVLVNHQKAAIVGTICMDMLMIDVTEIQAEVGSEVMVFGNDLRITEVAKLWETIPYEVMTSISQRVKRVFFKE